MVAADFDAYAAAQRKVDRIWTEESAWYGMDDPEHSAGRMVFIGPDHRQYAAEIWNVPA